MPWEAKPVRRLHGAWGVAERFLGERAINQEPVQTAIRQAHATLIARPEPPHLL